MSENKAEPRASGGHPDGRNLRVPCLRRLDDRDIEEHLEQKRFFWLDLERPEREEVEQLGRLLHLHPLAVEDTCRFGQRPKLDDYGDYVFLVFYGAEEEDSEEPVREVHIYVSGDWIVTVHRRPLPALEAQRRVIDQRLMHSEQFVVYRLLDALTDTFFPPLSRIDDEIDTIEDAIIEGADQEQLNRIVALKRQLVVMRRVVTPQRDLFARSIDTIADLPGLTIDERDYFRDVYDHLIRISDLLDSYRDLLSGAMDVYLSAISNRQNEVMKQLTVIATIFLPLTFITGFFGQNFSWLVGHITGPARFVIYGVGSLVLSCVLLVLWFRRRRWV